MSEKKTGAMLATLRVLLPHIAPHKGLLAGGTAALVLEVLFRVMEPWPLKIILDTVLSPKEPVASRPIPAVVMLIGLGVLHIVIVGGRAACNYLATVSFALTGSRAATALRARLFHHVQGLSLQFHARNRSADTVQRIVSDVGRMQEVAVTAGLPLSANLATLVAMIVIMAVLDPFLALVVVAAILLFVSTTTGTSKRITQASRRTRAGEGKLANTAQESLISIKAVQAYTLESFMEKRFTGANSTSLKEGVAALRLAARLERGTDIIIGLAVATVMVIGGYRVLHGAITVGDLVLFVSYLRTAMKPLRDMAKYTGRISRANASGERVAALLNVQPDIVTPEHPTRLDHIRGQIGFEGIVTRYEDSEILHGITLNIAPGQHVAIIGPSGAGKSTLISLIIREIDPVEGRVLLDGVPLTSLDLAQLRSCVTVLHQDAVILAGTIRENIALGRLNASDEQIEAAARAANAHDFICEQPDGYDTLVGERGATLSGGQKQRIAIARALLRDTPVVLLDEATTGLDPQAAQLVLNAVDVLARGRTTITVTHHPKAALRAERVIWIDDGRVLLDASPNELMEHSELFREWARMSDSDSGRRRA